LGIRIPYAVRENRVKVPALPDQTVKIGYLGIQFENNRVFTFYILGKVIIGKHDINAFASRGIDVAAVDITAVDQN
jgi:hypothetical protein